MKKIVLLLLSVVLISSYSFAQLNGDGYYRVKNATTNRYIYVIDNYGSINVATTSADMGAIELWKNPTKALQDPASILYIKQIGTNSNGPYYDITAQGTGIHNIIGYYINIYTSGSNYIVYAEGKYLDDDETSMSRDRGALGTLRSTTRKWTVEPVDATTNYLGVAPSVEVNGKYYAQYYTDFGYTFYSPNMKAYYVSKIIDKYAIISELSSVSNAVPVIIECGSNSYTENKITPQYVPSGAPIDNLLKGVYFHDEDDVCSYSLTANNSETMRVLGVTSDGKLGYVKSTAEYLPANQSYLSVPAGTPDELIVMTEEEYKLSGISGVKVTANSKSPVYSTSGIKVAENSSNINQLPSGIYISGGKKVMVK